MLELVVVVCGKGVNESSYSSSTRKILKFNLELIELSSSRVVQVVCRVEFVYHNTRAGCELNGVLLFY